MGCWKEILLLHFLTCKLNISMACFKCNTGFMAAKSWIQPELDYLVELIDPMHI